MEQNSTVTNAYTALYSDGKFEKITLSEMVNRGGAAGKIFLVKEHPTLVAKIFHNKNKSATNRQKLEAMLLNPPNFPPAIKDGIVAKAVSDINAAESEDADAETLLRKFAQRVLPPRALELARRCGVSTGTVSVRAQRSRWGSCSSGGALSLNWRLVLLPAELQDHVILHELAHRVHMDHSGEFWDLLNAWDPETGRHDRELSRRWAPLVFSMLPE